MRRSWPILMAITALLAGCSSGSSTPATVTVTESPAASASLDDTVTDVKEVGFFSQQFHPCEAFTEEQLERAGLGEHSKAADGFENGIWTCGFRSSDVEALDGTFLVATDPMNREQIGELGFDPIGWAASDLEGIYVHKMPSQVRQCTAAIDYPWGRFLVGYRERGEGWDADALCSKPALILESLLIQAGGEYGTQN